MTIKELQEKVRDALNGVEELVNGGCRAFAEDTHKVYNEADPWATAGKVALVVVTPDMQRNGDTTGGIPAETQLLVQCSEKPAVSRTKPGVITALDAAELVMHALDGSQFCWISTRQTFNEKSGVLTATATFETTVKLTQTRKE